MRIYHGNVPCSQSRMLYVTGFSSSKVLYNRLGLERAIAGHLHGNQNSIQGCTSQKLIFTYKELETLVTKNQGLAHTSNLHIVLSSGANRYAVFKFVRIVNKLDSRCLGECFRAASTSTSFSVSTIMTSECARIVGMRTALQLMGKSSPRLQTLPDSQTTFISSLV